MPLHSGPSAVFRMHSRCCRGWSQCAIEVDAECSVAHVHRVFQERGSELMPIGASPFKGKAYNTSLLPKAAQ